MVLAVVAGLTLLLIALVLVAAVRVQAESRREETAVLQLAGAQTSFIVRPYAYAGAMTLGLGAALAFAIAVGGALIVEPRDRCTGGHLWAGLPSRNAAGLAATRGCPLGRRLGARGSGDRRPSRGCWSTATQSEQMLTYDHRFAFRLPERIARD